MRGKSNKGFSLVELVITIGIMAVLIGVLAPQIIKYVEKSKESCDITNLDSCVDVVKTHYTNKEGHPDEVTITAGGKGKFFTSSDSNAALIGAGAANTIQKGTWKKGNPTAVVNLNTGEVTYTGESSNFSVVGGIFTSK